MPALVAVRPESLKGQLDLFAHSRTVILMNDLVDCLLERSTARVSERLQLLRAEAPGHPALQALGTLHDSLARWPVAVAGPSDTAQVVEWLDGKVAPAATAVLGASAAAFMRDRKSTRLNSSHDQISYAVF